MARFQVKTTLDGVADVMQALERVKRSVRGKILRKALTEGAKPVTKALKARVPRETGLAQKSVGSVVSIRRESGVGIATIGPWVGKRKQQTKKLVTVKVRFIAKVLKAVKSRKGRVIGTRATMKTVKFTKRQYRDPRKYFHLFEQAVRQHSLGAGSKLRRKQFASGKNKQSGATHPGLSAKQPLEKALEASRSQAVSTVRRAILEGLEQEARK